MGMLAMLKSNIDKELMETPSAVTNWLKGTLRFAEKGELAIEYLVRNEMTNPLGSLHGGMISMIHDDIIGMCVLTLDKDVPYTSINLTVDFLKSSRKDDIIVCEAKVVRGGHKIIYLHSSMYKIKGDEKILISKASSNMLRFE